MSNLPRLTSMPGAYLPRKGPILSRPASAFSSQQNSVSHSVGKAIFVSNEEKASLSSFPETCHFRR